MASYQTQYGNYVKFLRGTPTAWAKIAEQDKNTDTLYFISEAGAAYGDLYLGPKLISKGGLTSATSMKDLNDVLIGEGITDQSILVYNDESEKWEPKSLFEVLLAIHTVFKGATADQNGAAGLVPVPKAGEQDLFLRADATWADPVGDMRTEVGDLKDKLNTLIGDDEGISARDIAKDEIFKQVTNAPDIFDSLQDLADWLEQHPDIGDLADINKKLRELDETVNGSEDPMKEGLVQITSNLSISVQTLEGDVAEIKYALKWQDIIEE